MFKSEIESLNINSIQLNYSRLKRVSTCASDIYPSKFKD